MLGHRLCHHVHKSGEHLPPYQFHIHQCPVHGIPLALAFYHGRHVCYDVCRVAQFCHGALFTSLAHDTLHLGMRTAWSLAHQGIHPAHNLHSHILLQQDGRIVLVERHKPRASLFVAIKGFQGHLAVYGSHHYIAIPKDTVHTQLYPVACQYAGILHGIALHPDVVHPFQFCKFTGHHYILIPGYIARHCRDTGQHLVLKTRYQRIARHWLPPCLLQQVKHFFLFLSVHSHFCICRTPRH